MKTAFCAAGLLLCLAGAARAGMVPDTGQAACYDITGPIACPDQGQPFYGQDAQYAAGGRLFKKLDAQGSKLADTAPAWNMVRDTVTGLVWEIKNSGNGLADYSNPHDSDNQYSWFEDNASRNGGNAGLEAEHDTRDFLQALNSSTFGGYSDWRLPTAKELIWVLDRGATAAPFITTRYFPVIADEYWTSTTDPTAPARCATVTLSVGMMNYPEKSGAYSAMAVRGPKPQPGFRDNGDGTVCDSVTGLMWQQDSRQGISWDEGLAYCEDLQLAGYNDWRMPDINELISIIDYSKSSPSLNGAFSTINWHHWTATTYPSDPAMAYHVCFLRGRAEIYDKTDNSLAVSRVRAVRGPVESCIGATPDKKHCLVNELYGAQSREAKMLRRFRDRLLSIGPAGRALIHFYDQCSSSSELFLSSDYFQRGMRFCIDSAIAALAGVKALEP